MSNYKDLELKITYLKADQITPYINNTRTHSDEQIEQVKSSIAEFGMCSPIAIHDGVIVYGHARFQALKVRGYKRFPCLDLSHLSESQRKAYVITDNQLANLAGWDMDKLKIEIEDLGELKFNINLLGFDDDFLNDLLEEEPPKGLTDDDQLPDLDKIDEISVRGDVWRLGWNKVMCGDSTIIEDIEKLTEGEKALLLHADPPYGMGKESDGVANDNLYNDALDDFQLAWWVAFRTQLHDNASAYIWGNAPELWRLWYTRLEMTEQMELRNQIVWDKKSISGMKSGRARKYPVTTEHCLFIQIGKQSNIVSLTAAKLKEVCGVKMYSRWFTKSEFALIPEKHYKALQANFDAFAKPWSDLKKSFDKIKGSINESKKRSVVLGEGISYFDNAHDIMRDVWEFPRVVGEERHDHATPKPVAMMERVMRSSLPPKGLCLEPFGGSGSTLMGAEKTGRRCYTMELQPYYVDVIVNRWQDFTGKKAIHVDTGKTYEEIKGERL